jgi:hypothetical protein
MLPRSEDCGVVDEDRGACWEMKSLEIQICFFEAAENQQ